jgi:hypothetical protein
MAKIIKKVDEMAEEIDKIIITCMDRRLNETLDEMNDCRTVILRNAGGDVDSLRKSLQEQFKLHPKINKVEVLTHNDCGAMKYILNLTPEDYDLNRGLVEKFKDIEAKSLGELERVNLILQTSSAEDICSRKNLNKTELTYIVSNEIDLSKMESGKQHHGEHFLVVIPPTTEKYGKIAKDLGLDPKECYFIQVGHWEEAIPSIAIAAKKLGIKEMFMPALGNLKPLTDLDTANKMVSDRGFDLNISSPVILERVKIY